jgi:hypothetical protein
MATPNLKEGVVTVIDIKDWRTVKEIRTLGPGFFMRSHENTRYAWVDAMMSPHKDTLQVIDKQTLEIVAFPDDDCTYPPGLLTRVAERFDGDLELDGLTGRAEDASGRSSASWRAEPATLTADNLWNRAISFTIFLRAAVVVRVGAFDERLGLGSPEPWSSAEEIDYLIRAVRGGARIEYDPSLVVRHAVRVDDAGIGFRDGASIGYLLRKHRYPARTVARMMVRPMGGVVVSLGRFDRPRAAYNAATLRGRVRGYRGASRSKSSR